MELGVGAKLGQFEIAGVLGKGGMGEVYRARDTKLARDVAIKVMPAEIASDRDYLKRFEQEAKVLASLDHPNVGAIYDFQHDGDTYFLVMQLVEGETLSARIARGALPLREALPIFTQIARGLDAAHERGLVHRDLKPANVKITPKGEVKVLDFGIAKDTSQTQVDHDAPTTPMTASPVTGEGLVVGTPQYMSPEQARGKPVDRRTDVWAFGCCLYEALTGQRPYDGETVTDIVGAIVHKDLDWSPLPAVPPRVESILHRSLEKDAHKRLSSVGDIAIHLEEAQEALKNRRTNTEKSAPGWAGMAFALAALAIIVGGAITIAGMMTGRDTSPSSVVSGQDAITSIAVLPLENLINDPEQDYFVDGMTEAITGELSKISSLKVISRTSTERYKDTGLSMPEIADELGVVGLIEGSVQREGDDVRIAVRLYDGPNETQLWSDDYSNTVTSVLKLQGEIALAIAREIRAEVEIDERKRIADKSDVNPEAIEAHLRGRVLMRSREKADLEQALEHFQRAIELESDFAPAYAGLADAHNLLAIFAFAPASAYAMAIQAAEKAIALDPTDDTAHASLGLALMASKGDWEGARRAFESFSALKSSEVQGHLWYGGYLFWQGRVLEAQVAFDRALELDPHSLKAAEFVAANYSRRGNYDEAVSRLLILLRDHPNFYSAYESLAGTYLQMGRVEDALELSDRYRRARDNDFRSTVSMARLLAKIGRHEEAEQLFRSVPDPGSRFELGYHAARGDMDAALRTVRAGIDEGSFPFHIATVHWATPLHGDDRYWELIDELGFPRFTPEHPYYEQQQDYLIRKAAKEMLAEQGLSGAATIDSLAVLPLRNLSERGEEDYFAESMTEAITAELGKIKALKIRGRTSAMQYKDTELGIPEIAKALDVGALIEGTVTREGDDVRINITLQHGATDTQLWTGAYTETITSVLKLQSDVALAIAEAVNTEITGEERARITTTRKVDPRAHEFYVLGQHSRKSKTPDAVRSTIRFFEQVVEVDPQFAEGWVNLGYAYSELSGWGFGDADEWIPKARSSYERAIEIDPDSGDAYVGLMEISMTYDHDWSAARRYGERAVDLSPNSAGVLYHYAWFLMSVGEVEAAYALAVKALDIDYENPEVVREVAFIFLDAGRVDDARTLLENYHSEHPEYDLVYDVLSFIYLTLGMEKEAMDSVSRFVGPIHAKPELAETHADFLAFFGKKAQARSALNQLLDEHPESILWNLDVAAAFVDLGDIDRSFEWFEKGIAAKEWMVVRFKQLPYTPSTLDRDEWRELRTHDRFWELCDRLGYPPFPADHPGFEDEVRWMAKKAAQEMLREAGGPQLLERIAVLPFENYSGDPEQQYFVNGMTDALTAELQKISNLAVISSSATRQYRDTDKSLKTIADELGADGLVTGSVFRSGNDIRITAELTDPDSLGSLWSEVYEDTMENVIKVQGQATLAIADAIRVAVSDEEQNRIAQELEINPEAYDNYLRGMERFQLRTETDIRAAMAHFERAISLEPTFVSPMAGLADAHVMLSAYWHMPPDEAIERAQEIAGRALEIDPDSVEARVSMGNSRNVYNLDFQNGERLFREALEHQPNYAMGHAWLAQAIAFYGSPNDARIHAKKAANLDPGHPVILFIQHGLGNFYAGELALAARKIRQTLEISPNHPFGLLILIEVYRALGDAENARATAERLMETDESNLSFRALHAATLADGGKIDQAKKILDDILKQASTEFVSSTVLSRLYFALGNEDKGFEHLAQSRGDVFGLPALRISPTYRDLRDDDRYWAIVDSLDLVPLPHDHPGFAQEQAWKVRQAAAQLLREQGVDAATTIRSLAVLPFDNFSGDPTLEYRSDGMTDTLTAELAKIGSLTIKARTSAMRYKSSDKPFGEIARELGVDGLIEGSIQMDDTDIVITAQLVDGRTGNHVWAENFSGTVESVLKLQGQVAIAIAEQLDAVLTEDETNAFVRAENVNPQAWDLYLHGVDAWRNRPGGTVDAAIAPLERAIEIAPDFTEAVALLAMVYNIRGVYLVDPESDWARSRELARRAYELNPRSVMANLGMARFATGAGYDWAGDIDHIDIALQIDPNNSYAYVRKSIYYRYTGRFADALAVLRRAQELDPLAPVASSEVLRILYQTGDYEALVREGEAVRSQFPEYWQIPYWLALAYGHLGRADKALALIPDARDPNVTSFDINEILIRAACGQANEVETLMAKADYETVGQRLIPAMILLGRSDEAFDFLARLETREDAYVRSGLGAIQMQPLWPDDRFWESYAEMRLPHLPTEHPAYEHQRRYLITQRAEELIAERGLRPAEQD